MFSALIKTFTGRAGFLPSLLALVLIALTAAAILLNIPRIEQKLIESSQTVLQQTLAENDQLHSVQAEGRNILIDGVFEDVDSVIAQLKQINGVRGVQVTASKAKLMAEPRESGDGTNLAGADTADSVADNTGSETDIAAIVVSQDASAVEDSPAIIEQPASAESSVAEPQIESVVDQSDSTMEASGLLAPSESIDQSSLVLRYDGTQLLLSGYLADDKTVELISREVSNAVPASSDLGISLESGSQPSSLNWMKEFLEAVSGLPDDAQGVIQGSDNMGVAIVPDAQQSLRVRADTASGEGGSTAGEFSANLQQEVPDSSMPELEPQVAFQAEVESEEALQIVSESSVTDEAGQSEVSAEISPQVVQNEAISQAEATLEMEAAGLATLDDSMGRLNADAAAVSPVSEIASNAPTMHPIKFIDGLNQRIAEQPVFEAGQFKISRELAAELDQLARVMIQNPRLLLRVVGNLDFDVERRNARFVGIDRAREIRDYLVGHRVEPFRVFAVPLPRNYAFDKYVQIIFYITE